MSNVIPISKKTSNVKNGFLNSKNLESYFAWLDDCIANLAYDADLEAIDDLSLHNKKNRRDLAIYLAQSVMKASRDIQTDDITPINLRNKETIKFFEEVESHEPENGYRNWRKCIQNSALERGWSIHPDIDEGLISESFDHPLATNSRFSQPAIETISNFIKIHYDDSFLSKSAPITIAVDKVPSYSSLLKTIYKLSFTLIEAKPISISDQDSSIDTHLIGHVCLGWAFIRLRDLIDPTSPHLE